MVKEKQGDFKMTMRSLFHRSKRSLTAEELEKLKKQLEADQKAAIKKANKSTATSAAKTPATTKKENK